MMLNSRNDSSEYFDIILFELSVEFRLNFVVSSTELIAGRNNFSFNESKAICTLGLSCINGRVSITTHYSVRGHVLELRKAANGALRLLPWVLTLRPGVMHVHTRGVSIPGVLTTDGFSRNSSGQ